MKFHQDSNSQLMDLFASVTRVAEIADVKIERANQLILRGQSLGIFKPQILLGSIATSDPYFPDIFGSGQLLQAAIQIPNGFGGVYWDSDEFAARGEIDRILDAEGKMIPFHRFMNWERSQLFWHFPSLWNDFMGKMPLKFRTNPIEINSTVR